VLDYLWGAPAAAAMVALLTARADRGRAMDWVQIGAVAGPTAELPSVVLGAYLAELPSLVEAIGSGALEVSARPVPLADVEAAWNTPEVAGLRTVLIP
jgi:hypothetical protein